MGYQDEAAKIIKSAEQSLVDEAQKALAQHDYPKAASLMGVAGDLRDIVIRLESVGEFSFRPVSEMVESAKVTSRAIQVLSKAKKNRALTNKGEYPKFLRDEEHLYKIGWSKADNSTYEHKAPKYVLLALLEKMKILALRKRLFTMGHILPIVKTEGQNELPSYQVYLCIAWLRKMNLITQHGRKGYSIPHPAKIEYSAEKAWRELPLIEILETLGE